MSVLFKLLVLVMTMTPFVFLADCVYREISQNRALQRLCTSVGPESNVAKVLAKAKEQHFNVRVGGPNGLDDSEWFDREYARIVDWHNQSNEKPSDVAVVFAKPGMGYYACVIEHKQGAVVEAQFVDRSS